MAISNFTLKRIYLEYKTRLENTKISKIVKISDYDFSFFLFSKKQESLIISLEPLNPYFLISSSYFKTINETSPFISSLKKYFENGVITKVDKIENDRIIILEIKKITPTYQTIINKLILCLIPHRTNAIIVDQNDVIISALKMSSSLDEENLIARGVKYIFSNQEDKTISKSDTIESLKNKIGSILYKDISKRIEQGEKIEDIITEILESNKYYSYKNDVLSINLKYSPCKEITLEELSKVYEQKEQEKYKKNHYDLVYHLVKHKLKGLRNKVNNLEKDYQKSLLKKDYIEIGNLLFMNQEKYVKGSSSIILDGIEIKLDEKLSLVENANKYFKQYQKSKKALEELIKQKNLALEKIDFFEKIENQLEFASLSDMDDIIFELKENKYLKDDVKKKANNKKKTEKVYNPHFIEIDGYKIGFGLSSYQNDFLTFTLAKKDDYFFHVKDSHGPHVIIFSSSPSEEAILFASEISLYFAKKELGEVYLCDKKDVKKIPGKIGKVIMNNYQTITINKIRESTIDSLKNLLSK